MHYLSRLLERAARVLFRHDATGRNAHMAAVPPVHPQLPTRCPSPEMWGALLAGARRRRAPHLWPSTKPPALLADSVADAPARSYVLPPEERVSALSVPVLEFR